MKLARDVTRKLTLYMRAAKATRSLNLAGFPLLPKSGNSAFNRGSYNTFIFWIKEVGLQNASCVFDVGANHGDFSQAASTIYPQASIYLFEPLPALWPGLERLAQFYGTWNIHRIGLGNVEGSLPLEVAAGDDTIASFLGFSDAYRRSNPEGNATDSIEARVERLDDFCARKSIDSIDLLKIDVEGFEFDVLAGGPTILRKTKAIIIEVSLIRQAGASADALGRMISRLQEAGFHIVDVIPSLFSPEETWRPLEYNLLARRSP